MEISYQKILDSYAEDDLLRLIDNLFIPRENKSPFIDKVVKLNNSQKIDIIETFFKLPERPEDSTFYNLWDFFYKILPSINNPLPKVMECVNRLVIKIINNGAANEMHTPFLEYCNNNGYLLMNVLDEVLDSQNPNWNYFIIPILVEGAKTDFQKFYDKAIDLLSSNNMKIKEKAVFAISKLEYPVSFNANDIYTSLIELAKGEFNEQVFGAIIFANNCFYNQKFIKENQLVEVLEVILKYDGALLVHETINLFRGNKINYSDKIINVILHYYYRTNIENQNMIYHLDHVLFYLIKQNEIRKAIELYEHLSEKYFSTIDLEKFKKFNLLLFQKESNLQNHLITKWLLSKKYVFYALLNRLVKNVLQSYIFVDKELIVNPSKEEMEFIIKKIIGWIYPYKPLEATCYIISLIDIAPTESYDTFIELIFNPLLINYPGKVRDYIESVLDNQNKKTQEVLNKALKRLRNYHDGLHKSNKIPELETSQRHKEEFFEYQHKIINQQYKEAQKKSVLGILSPRQIPILYGLSTIQYQIDRDGSKIRREQEMKKTEHTIEWPKLLLLDPVGFNLLIENFKIVGLEK